MHGTRALTALAVLLIYSHAWADNTITRWVEQALDTVSTQNIGTGPAARVYAMTTVAMYDAVNGIDRARHLSTREQAIVPADDAPLLGDRRAAAAAAAHAVLKSFVLVAGSAQDVALDGELAKELLDLQHLPTSFVSAGQNWGAQVGLAVIAARASDGTQTAETQPAGTGIGEYRAPFMNAQFRLMAPFGVESIEPYVARTPPALTSDRYSESFIEVKAVGNITDPDPTRTEIARHWQAEANTARETGLWFKAGIAIVELWRTDLSLSHTARLFALLGMAVADAVATAWTGKYDAHTWRPGDAIREAGMDDNPDTLPEAGWTPRNITFGNSPEYPSGTSTFAGAASTVLEGFYCTDRLPFAFDGEQGTRREYRRFSQAADEAGLSRIYSGIHFRFSKDDGLVSGRGVGREIVTTRLRRAGRCFGLLCACPQF